jgi:hypothetical protein
MKTLAYRLGHRNSLHAQWLSMRAYVIAFEAIGAIAADAGAFAHAWRKSLSARQRASPRVPMPEHGFFYTQPVNPNTADADDYFHVRYAKIIHRWRSGQYPAGLGNI